MISPVASGFPREPLLFLFRSVDPHDLVRPAQAGHFLDPLLQFAMLIHVTDNASGKYVGCVKRTATRGQWCVSAPYNWL